MIMVHTLGVADIIGRPALAVKVKQNENIHHASRGGGNVCQ